MSLAAPAVAIAHPPPVATMGHTAPLLPTPPSILGNPPIPTSVTPTLPVSMASSPAVITPTMAATALAAGSVPVPVGLVSTYYALTNGILMLS